MKKLCHRGGSNPPEHGAALVVTLIVCTVLAMVVVALMQNTGLDRASSRSIANQYRAKLAAESGLAEFVSSLSVLVASNDFAVLEATNGSTNFTVITRFLPGGSLNVYPLVSSSNGVTNPLGVASPFTMARIFSAASAVTNGANSTNLNAIFQRFGGVEYPASNSSALNLGAQFVRYFTNATGGADYAFFVSDECAKLNIARYGSAYTNGARTNQNPSDFVGEIAAADSGANTATVAQWSQFTNLAPSLRLAALFPSVFGNTNERSRKGRFYTAHQGEVFDLIPQGYLDDARSTFTAYGDANKFKYDLNKLATNSTDSRSNAFQIADIIGTNLANFYKRDPSLTNTTKPPSDPLLRYNRRISAAVVDYIDAGSAVTAITDDEPAGKELLAYPFQIAERYDWTTTTSAGTNSWDVTIKHALFVELWNPHTEPVSGDFSFELDPKQREFRTITNLPAANGSVVNQPIPPLGTGSTVPVSLNPNELKTYKIAEQSITVRIIGTTTNPATLPANSLYASGSSSTNTLRPQPSLFKAFWNGQVYDRTASYNTVLFNSRAAGLEKGNLSFSAANTTASPAWSANVGQSASGATWRRVVADPRHNYINSYVWSQAGYTSGNLRWQGAGTYATNTAQTQLFAQTWSYRDTMRALNTGNAPASANVDPTNIVSTYALVTDSNNAPAYVRNGPMLSIAELGNIYDPAHLDDSGAVTPTGATPNTVYSSGGGRTLRVGQPEFDYLTYTQGGQRAMNLLDIFTVRSNNATTNVATNARYAGLNINTAPTDVLAAFFYNLQPVSDRGVTGGNKISLAGATNIATNVIAGRPYYSASDMHRFMGALVEPGNFAPAMPTNTTSGRLNVLDRGREEIFRRAYNSIDTKSGAFRFYGIGRALTPNGEVQSQVALEAIVELRATTNSAGQPTLRPIIMQRKFL